MSDSPERTPLELLSHVATSFSPRTNVGPLQRVASVLVGGALTVGGLTNRSAAGYFAAAVGGALVARGAAGHCPVLSQLGIDMAADQNGQGASNDAPGGAPPTDD